MADFDELKRKAEELGIPVNSGVFKPRAEAWVELQIGEYELRRRIRDEERHRREHWLWIVALASAVASAVSAILNSLSTARPPAAAI
jgi:hypothetical protein